MMHSQK